MIIGLHAVGIDLTSDERAITTLLILLAVAPFTAIDTLFVSLFAVVAKPSAIFWRRHVLTPLLRLASVLGVIVTAGSVEQLAVFYLIAGVIGVALYVMMAIRAIRPLPLGASHERTYPFGELYRFGGPMVSSDVAQALRATLVVIFLEALRSVDDVGAFRAVLPLAQLNMVAMQSFKLLYLPCRPACSVAVTTRRSSISTGSRRPGWRWAPSRSSWPPSRLPSRWPATCWAPNSPIRPRRSPFSRSATT